MKFNIHFAITISEAIAKIYQKFSFYEQNNEDVFQTENYEQLQTLLKIENSIYSRLQLNEVQIYLDWIHTHHPDIFINLFEVMQGTFCFNPVYRVYSHLYFLYEQNNYYNEAHTFGMDANKSFTYLFSILFATILVKYYEQNKKSNRDLILIKYNLIFSFNILEQHFLKERNFSILSMKNYLQFLEIDKKKFDDDINNLLNDYVFNKLFVLQKEINYSSWLQIHLMHDMITIPFVKKILEGAEQYLDHKLNDSLKL